MSTISFGSDDACRALPPWLALTILMTTGAGAQEPVGTAPGASVLELTDAFHEVVSTDLAEGPDWDRLPESMREWIAEARAAEGAVVVPGFARVAHRSADRALLVLAAHVEFGGTAYETSASRGFSGFYEARRDSDGWRIGGLRPLDSQASIEAHALDVQVRPGFGLDVVDSMSIVVNGPGGFAAHLNHAIALRAVRSNGRPVAHEFGGGLLWIDVPAGEQDVVLEYAVDVARDSTAHPNSGHFAEAYGHVRSQYFWHPFFDFQSQAQKADVSLRVEGPADYQIASDMPQTDTVRDGRRVVTARSRELTYALSLFYDREWEPSIREVEGFRLARFATPGTPPSADTLAAAFSRAYRILADRFGAPSGGYLAVIQGRARDGSGWLFRTNDAMAIPAAGGARMSSGGAVPRAWFGHELAHGWTRPTGPAANFLREGWATYAESLLLADQYGPDIRPAFWELQRAVYFLNIDGQASILDDPNNQGVAYFKGAWILRMIEDLLGPAAFAEGFGRYMAIPPGEKAGHEEFARAMTRAGGLDVAAFIEPWLTETTVPAVTAEVRGTSLVLRQHGPVHALPLDLDIHTPGGVHRQSVYLASRDTVVPLEVADVEWVHVDPQRRLLIRRARGDTARFVFEPEGDVTPSSVQLDGFIAGGPRDARAGPDGRWTVDLELSEGRYIYWWIVDGERRSPRTMDVEPRREITSAVFGGGPPAG